MKESGVNVELVTEYAKDLVWAENIEALSNQLHVFAEQYHRMRRLEGKVDYIITDSPLLLSNIYMTESSFEHLEPLVWEAWNSFENINILVKRGGPYVNHGRIHTEEEALGIDEKIKQYLIDHGQKFTYSFRETETLGQCF